MHITEFTGEPEVIQYFLRPDGLREVWLRRNAKEVEKEEGIVWVAEEVMIITQLSEEEILEQLDSYFLPEPVPEEEHLRALIDYNVMMGNLEDPSADEEED